MKVKSHCGSPWVNLAFTVFTVYIACVTCFLISGSKKAMMQFFGVWFVKLKQQDTRVNYIESWAEKRKKRKKTKKAKQTTNWICFSLTEAMEKSKKKKVTCVSYWLQVSSAKLIYREKRNKIVIGLNKQTTALIIL